MDAPTPSHGAPQLAIPSERELVDDELRRLSCYTTAPDRTLELLEAARGRSPVAHSDEHDGFHLLLDHPDVRKAMGAHATFSSEPQVLRPMLPRRPIPGLEMDPPRHGDWRALYDRAITPTTAAAMEPWVRSDIDRRLDAVIGSGSCDLVEELFEPVPAETICHLVGIDDELVPVVRERALAMFAAQGDPEEFGRRQAAFAEVTVTEVRRRQREPRDDYLTALGAVQVEGRALDDEDYVGLMAAFLGAGHHSTTSAMTSLVAHVFDRPEVVAALLEDQQLIPVAVEESLRLRTPFFGFFRRATEDTEVAGVRIAAGDDVYMSWAAANRDPDVFAAPTEFRLDRRRNRHLSFGFGIHSCPGAPLARMELRVLLEQLLARVPDLTLEVTDLDYRFGGGDYAYAPALPVRFTPGPRVGERQ